MRWIAAILILYLTACADTHSDVGKYVYVDCFNTIHTDRDCAANLTDDPKTKEERMANMQGVLFVDTCTLDMNSWRSSGVMRNAPYQFCPKCVDDEAYTRINAIMNRNSVKPPAY